MSGTHSPSADGGFADSLAPRTFQGRLTLAFVAVVAVTLGLVGLLVVNRLGAYFDQQQVDDLAARARTVAQYVILTVERTSAVRNARPVISAEGIVDAVVVAELTLESQQRIMADHLGRADIKVQLGLLDGNTFKPSANGLFEALERAEQEPRQTRERITSEPALEKVTSASIPYAVQVTLQNPYTYRAIAISNVSGLLAITGLIALAIAVVVAALVTRRITTPLRRLTEASRGLAEGDFARRVPTEAIDESPVELANLGLQFNTMAGRLQESIEIIRHDRDRSREFLADVSHELRTPIAALRTFNELLVEGAANDPTARSEFLETSRAQLERLDWLAQNLLELSKLDSGLVLLDLRREDLRSTVEQAVDHASTSARRRGVELVMHHEDAQLQLRHDPARIGQVVTNLVGNALKFTPKGGRVDVRVQALQGGSVAIIVADTGIGIDPAELPRIFDRFFRGSRASEARGSGSGLGLSIVRSIVEMHGGNISVESRVGAGTTFRVTLPEQPRVAETSPVTARNLNPDGAP